MKFKIVRLAFVSSVFGIFGFLISGCLQTPFASTTQQQQRPEKPSLQKPRTPEDGPPPSQKDEGEIKLGRTMVTLDVTVVDPANKPVMDLKQDEFVVTEDKVPQKIEFFGREQVPVSLVFAIDTSGSMRPKLDTVVKASTNLVKESRKGDEIGVIEFKDQPELLEEFTSDVNDVIDTLNGLVASRQTAMLDALYLAADYANKEGKNRRKAVMVVTDGLDNDSYYKFGEVVNHLREIDVQVYLIGFINDLDKESGLFKKSPKDKAEGLLNKLAEETGGKAFFPKELSEVHAIAQQISTDLRTQYSLSYYPSNSKKDGTYRAVKVQVSSAARRLIARTRPGYTAPTEGGRIGSDKH
ncbi:MAG TPA: VWA domain-containing protein [Blastocatellia bacterium]|nr:VWA domain-containing protein [Blastocatellia bacterium]